MNSPVLDLMSVPAPVEGEETAAPGSTPQKLSVAVGFTWIVLAGLTMFLIGRLFLMQSWCQAC